MNFLAGVGVGTIIGAVVVIAVVVFIVFRELKSWD